MSASFWHRLYEKRLFTVDEVAQIIETILENTYQKDDVVEAFKETDTFAAGAVDKHLREHIIAVFKHLEGKDIREDPERLKAWKTILSE